MHPRVLCLLMIDRLDDPTVCRATLDLRYRLAAQMVAEQGEEVWRDGEPVLDPESAQIVAEMRADPRFRAKSQRRF